jgi:septum site-determining protein MinC
MTTTKSYVTIKGTKDGLVFNMDDTCSYQDIILELKDKLESGHHLFLKGPLIRVTVRLGYRYLTPGQEKELKDFIRSMGNLVVDQLESHVVSKAEVEKARIQANIQMIQRTIRSGQVYQYDGNALILGDVNPGGCIQASGNIYVMGSLRGMAHAGINGDSKAIIAASILQPTQLRIANIVSRQPDEWEEEQYQMEFAYIEGTQIVIDKLHHLTEIRPGLQSLI